MKCAPDDVPLTLRPMTEQDLPMVMAIEVEAYPWPWTEGIMRDCLKGAYSCWVLEAEADLVGYAVCSMVLDEAHILNLCIRPQQQGRGLGRYLLQQMLHLFRRRQAMTVFLEVRRSNRVAQQLYQAIGFNQVGERFAYYPVDKGYEDGVVMAMTL